MPTPAVAIPIQHLYQRRIVPKNSLSAYPIPQPNDIIITKGGYPNPDTESNGALAQMQTPRLISLLTYYLQQDVIYLQASDLS